MMKSVLMLASFANAAAGIVLIAIWVFGRGHVPPIVVFIGLSLLIQGLYTIGYLRGTFRQWGEIATGALLAGQALSACVGAVGLIQSVLSNINAPNGDVEMAPVLAGLMMTGQAALALLHLVMSGQLRPVAS